MIQFTEAIDFKRVQNEVRTSSRRVWLAGLGVVATGVEEGQNLFNEFVERGKKAEAFGKKSWTRTRKELESTTGEVSEKLEELGSKLDQRVSDVLQRMGVPSRNQVEQLTSRVEKLSRQVDRLTGSPKHPSRKRSTAKKSAGKSTRAA